MRGLYTVFRKELADYFISWRGIILFAVVLMATVIAIYGPAGALANIRAELEVPTQFGMTEFVFLKLFTTSSQKATGFFDPSFLGIIAAFLVPVLGIALGFDAINGEKNSGTLGRLLSQPIYRDTVFNGKFLAGLVTIAVMLVSIVLLMSGLGLRMIGVAPSSEEALRLLLFLVVAVLYGAFWLGLSMLFSVFMQRVATSMLASIAVWLFFLFFIRLIAGSVADAIAPVSDTSTTEELIRNASVQINVARVSPLFLFQEATAVLLIPGARTFGETVELLTASGAQFMPGALPIGQTLTTIWPHIVAFVATAAVCFGISYYRFTREEIRST